MAFGSTRTSSVLLRSEANTKPPPESAEVVPSPWPPPNLSPSAENPAIDSIFKVAGSIRSSLPVRPAGASTRCSDDENIRSSKPIPASPPGRASLVGFAICGLASATVAIVSNAVPAPAVRIMGKAPRLLARGLPALVDRGPVDVREERVDVLRVGGAVVDRVRVLEHVEYEERRAGGKGGRMAAGADHAQVVGQRGVLDHDPAGPAAQRHRGRPEQLLPARGRPELRRQRLREVAGRLAIAAEVLEVALVEIRRVRVGQLALAQAGDLEAGGVLGDLGELELDGVQVLDRARVVVVVVRGQEPLREPGELGGVERQRDGLVPAGLDRRECRPGVLRSEE